MVGNGNGRERGTTLLSPQALSLSGSPAPETMKENGAMVAALARLLVPLQDELRALQQIVSTRPSGRRCRCIFCGCTAHTRRDGFIAR